MYHQSVERMTAKPVRRPIKVGEGILTSGCGVLVARVGPRHNLCSRLVGCGDLEGGSRGFITKKRFYTPLI